MQRNNGDSSSTQSSDRQGPRMKSQCSRRLYCVQTKSCGCEPKTIDVKKSKQYNIVLTGKPDQIETIYIFYRFIKILAKTESTFFLQSDQLQELKTLILDSMDNSKYNIQLWDPIAQEGQTDFLVTVGGDGTILYALKQFQKLQVPPLIAIEKGTLGFMAMYQVSTLERDLYHLAEKLEKVNHNIHVEEKIRLTVTVKQIENDVPTNTIGIYHALNEIVIDRGQASVVKLDIYANEIPLTQFWGDGLIISTPTGSTAYNMSAGGPILYNEVNGITLTPLAPFTLSFRPIILPNCTKFRIRLCKDSRSEGQICADGNFKIPLKHDQEVQIEESEFPVLMVRERSEDFFNEWVSKLKKLLNWNNTTFDKQN